MDQSHAESVLREVLAKSPTIYAQRVDFYRKAEKKYFVFLIVEDGRITDITSYVSRYTGLKRDVDGRTQSGGIATRDLHSTIENLSHSLGMPIQFRRIG